MCISVVLPEDSSVSIVGDLDELDGCRIIKLSIFLPFIYPHPRQEAGET